MSEAEKTVSRPGEEDAKRLSSKDSSLEKGLDNIGPTAKRIMLAQPLNPFIRIPIRIIPRGALF